MKIEIYTGGDLETNAYYLPEARMLIDAPEGVYDEAKKRGWEINTLALTHGHYDHIMDAGKFKDAGCRILYHKADENMLLTPSLWRMLGLFLNLPPVKADAYLEEGQPLVTEDISWTLFHIPGHSLGSICFYSPENGVVFGGDVLFRGGVGRWDLPGGSQGQLLSGIQNKLLTLPNEVAVYPGHGQSTSIGREREKNPYLS